MPQPDFVDLPYDPMEHPDVSLEILGRGAGTRKSKSYIPNIRLATQLTFISTHTRMLYDLFRRLHAHHYTATHTIEDKDGKTHEVTGPEILSDKEIDMRYPAVAAWGTIHREVVDTYPSIEGFSIDRTTGYNQGVAAGGRDPRKREESSAGADRNRTPARDNKRWE